MTNSRMSEALERADVIGVRPRVRVAPGTQGQRPNQDAAPGGQARLVGPPTQGRAAERFGPVKKSRKVGRSPRIADDAGEILDQLRDEAWRWWAWIKACETRLDDRDKQLPRQAALKKALTATTSAIEGLLEQLSPAKPRTPAKRRRCRKAAKTSRTRLRRIWRAPRPSYRFRGETGI